MTHACRLAAGLALLAASLVRADPVLVDIRQVTDVRVTVSPDGSTLITDLLGQLWSLPAAGGGATPLTPVDEVSRAPRFSHDGHHVVYQRLFDGRWDLWQLDLADKSRAPLTGPPFNERDPTYTDQGRAVVFTSDRSGSDQLWRLELADGSLSQLTFEGTASDPAASDFGDIAYVARQGEHWSLRLLTPGGGSSELVASEHPLAAPSWRPGGGVLVYEEIEPGKRSELEMLVLSENLVTKALTHLEDVSVGPVAWLSPNAYLYAADGQIWRRGLALTARYPVPMFASVAVTPRAPPPADPGEYTRGPHAARTSPLVANADGDRYVFTALGDLWLVSQAGALRQLTDDAYIDTEPGFAADGNVIFASDRGGKMALWQLTLADNALAPLHSGRDRAYYPRVSPEGTRVAFLSTPGLGPWADSSLELLELGTGRPPQTLATHLIAPGRPVWKPDGTAVTLEVSASSGQPQRRQSLEIDTGPAPSAEPARRRGGTNRGGHAPPVPEISWRRAADETPYVIQVGRLFDGIGTSYHHHMDIHIRDGRIAAVVARGIDPLPAKVIDARDLTIVPGLIDLHAHESVLGGERLGRCWLYHGVTTVREIGADPDATAERAETWASGHSLGPRVVAAAPAAAGELASGAIATSLAHLLAHGSGARSWPDMRSPLPPGLAALGVVPGPNLGFSPLGLSYQDVTGVLAASGTVVLPSLAALDPGPGPAHADGASPCEAPVAMGERGAAPPAELVEGFGKTLLRLLGSGGHVGIGSEAPVTGYGSGYHEELGRLAAAGIPNDRLLRLATGEAALALGLDRELGTIETGKLADLLVISGDPLERIGDLERIVAVVKNGVWHDRDELLDGPSAAHSNDTPEHPKR